MALPTMGAKRMRWNRYQLPLAHRRALRCCAHHRAALRASRGQGFSTSSIRALLRILCSSISSPRIYRLSVLLVAAPARVAHTHGDRQAALP